MNYKINKTHPGVKSYPIHYHSDWEVMCYVYGLGTMNTEVGKISFHRGSIIAIPPGMNHGSESKTEDEFCNISVGADLSLFFDGKAPIVINDTENEDALTLATMIWENRYGDNTFVSSLIQSLAYLIKSKTVYNDPLQKTIYEIKSEICNRFADAEFRPEALLLNCGYSPDYIRNKFKQTVQHSPIEYLNLIRISESVRIFEIYGRSASVAHTAELCGFSDPVYFSRCFKKIKGISPEKFRMTL